MKRLHHLTLTVPLLLLAAGCSRSPDDRKLEKLEDERKQIASERQRAPVIAAANAQFGLLLACLAPLGLAAHLLWTLRHSEANAAGWQIAVSYRGREVITGFGVEP